MRKLTGRWLQLIMVVLVSGGLIFLALGGYLAPISKVAIVPLVTVQSWFSSRFMALYEFITVPRDVASLRQRNADLEVSLSRLQTRVIELEQRLAEAEVLYALLDFARARPENQYLAAAVIGKDPDPFIKYIQIDRGSDNGIRRGMPVVTQQGLVGRIDAVTSSAARVQLITDPSSSINVRLQSAQVDGILLGSITGDLNLDFLPLEVEINPGDIILTSGLGGNYPANLFIGQVISVRSREASLFQSATVQSVVDFSALKAVLVIVNFQPIDITPLIPVENP